MPEFLEESIKNLTQFAIWEIEESEDELSKGLTISHVEKKKIKSTKKSCPQKRVFSYKTIIEKIWNSSWE